MRVLLGGLFGRRGIFPDDKSLSLGKISCSMWRAGMRKTGS